MILKLFRSAKERYLRKFKKTVQKINAMEADFEKLTDAQLTAKTAEYRERLKQGETLESLLPEAFATVREAAKRVSFRCGEGGLRQAPQEDRLQVSGSNSPTRPSGRGWIGSRVFRSRRRVRRTRWTRLPDL